MKKKNLLIVCGSVCLLFALFAGCGERSGEKEYNKATKSWLRGDLSRAQGQMEKAIRKLSDRERKSVANNQLGIILWGLGKNEQAAEKFSESCRLAGEVTGADLNLGIALYHTGQLDAAEFEFTKILSEQPGNTTACTFAALIQMQKKEWEKGITEVTAGLKTNPADPAAHNALALAQLHINSGSEKAIQRLKQLAAAHPDYAPAAYNLGAIYDHWLHDEKSARGWYLQYLERAGESGSQVNAAKQAIARLEKGTSSGGSTVTATGDPAAASRLVAEGSKLHSEDKYTEAIARYKQALRLNPADKTAHYYMGLSYYKLMNYPEAIGAYTEALTIDPRNADARYMLSLAYCQQKKWSDAEREAKALENIDSTRGAELLKYIAAARRR